MKIFFRTLSILFIITTLCGLRCAIGETVTGARATESKSAAAETRKDIVVQTPANAGSLQRDKTSLDLCRNYKKSAEYNKAVECLDQLIVRTSDKKIKLKSLCLKGISLENLERNSSAEKVYKQIIKEYPNSDEAKSLLFGEKHTGFLSMTGKHHLFQSWPVQALEPIANWLFNMPGKGGKGINAGMWLSIIYVFILSAIIAAAVLIIAAAGATLKVMPEGGNIFLIKLCGFFLLINIPRVFGFIAAAPVYMIVGIPVSHILFRKDLEFEKAGGAGEVSILKAVSVTAAGGVLYLFSLAVISLIFKRFLGDAFKIGYDIWPVTAAEIVPLFSPTNLLILPLGVIYEEIIFRGVVFRFLARKNIIFATVASAFIFTVNFTVYPVQSLVVFAMGIIACIVYRASGMRLAAPIIMRLASLSLLMALYFF